MFLFNVVGQGEIRGRVSFAFRFVFAMGKNERKKEREKGKERFLTYSLRSTLRRPIQIIEEFLESNCWKTI